MSGTTSMRHGFDARAGLAASNNAGLYRAVFNARRLRYRQTGYAFIAIDPPPPYYANMTTLMPDATEDQLAVIEEMRRTASSRFSIKDSFSALEMADAGMTMLFEASWIWASPADLPTREAGDWQRVDCEDQLAAWEWAWSDENPIPRERMFPASILLQDEIAFYGKHDGARFSAGCIVNRSAGCVGISNMFSRKADEARFWTAASCAAQFAPRQPIVGYDRGASLGSMLSLGFTDVGRLRVWVDDART